MYEFDAFNGWHYQIRSSINSFRQLVDSQIEVLDKTEKAFYKQVEKSKDYSQWDDVTKQNSIWMEHREEITSFNDMRRWNSYSLVLAMFSFLESKLTEIDSFCKTRRMKIYFRQEASNNRQEEDHISKTYFWRRYSSLRNITGISLTNARSYAVTIDRQYFIRNKIAHQNGVFRKSEQKKTLESPFPGLIVSKRGKICVVLVDIKEYSEQLLKEIEGLFIELLKSLDDVYKVEKAKRNHIDLSTIPHDRRLRFEKLAPLVGKSIKEPQVARLLQSISKSYEGPIQVTEPYEEDISSPSEDFVFFDFSACGLVFECVAGYFAQVTFYGVAENYLTGEVREPFYRYPLFGDFDLRSTREDVRRRFGKPLQEISHIDQFLLGTDKILAIKYNPSAAGHVAWVSIGASCVYRNPDNFPTRLDGIADALDVDNLTFRNRFWWSEPDPRFPNQDHTLEDIVGNVPDADE